VTLLSFSASIVLLADDSTATNIGYLIGTLLFPAVGVILLVIGLVERSKAKRVQPSYPPGYPPVAPPRPMAGRGLITAGTILIAISLAGAVARLASSAGAKAIVNCTGPPS
jgi:hypothetical protein